jgi:hypothetical protein
MRFGTRRQLATAALALAAAPAALAGTTAAPTIAASAKAVSFGASLTLSGKLAGAPAGQELRVYAQACRFTGAVRIGTTQTAAGGSYTFKLEPMLNTTYFVKSDDAQSAARGVSVSPLLQVRRVSGRLFAVDVSVGGGEFFTSPVVLQRYDSAKKHWRQVGVGTLKPNSDPTAITAVSSATVRAKVAAGTKLRAVMTQSAVGSCYRPAVSATLTA